MSFTITIGWWIIPVILTLGMLGMTLRPWESEGPYDISFLFRILWLIPILFVWVVYLAIALILK